MVLIKTKKEIPSSEITPEAVYLSRRKFIGQSSAVVAAGALAQSSLALPDSWIEDNGYEPGEEIGEDITPEKHATSYNNFFEFGTRKQDPAAHAHQMTVEPWSIEIKGQWRNRVCCRWRMFSKISIERNESIDFVV